MFNFNHHNNEFNNIKLRLQGSDVSTLNQGRDNNFFQQIFSLSARFFTFFPSNVPFKAGREAPKSFSRVPRIENYSDLMYRNFEGIF